MNRPYTLYVRAKEGYTEFTFLVDIFVQENPPQAYHGRYCIDWRADFAFEVTVMFDFMEHSLRLIEGATLIGL